jgi:hypothetical protein
MNAPPPHFTNGAEPVGVLTVRACGLAALDFLK